MSEAPPILQPIKIVVIERLRIDADIAIGPILVVLEAALDRDLAFLQALKPIRLYALKIHELLVREPLSLRHGPHVKVAEVPFLKDMQQCGRPTSV